MRYRGVRLPAELHSALFDMKFSDERSVAVVISRIKKFYCENGGENTVRRGKWNLLLWKIKNTLDRPLEIIGSPGSGKTTLMKTLIKKDDSSIYFVIDTHREFDFLPMVRGLAEGVTLGKSCRIVPRHDIEFSQREISLDVIRDIFELKFPDNFILVVEEAGRYSGLNFFGNESRKFCKTILISCNKLFGDRDTIESVRIVRE